MQRAGWIDWTVCCNGTNFVLQSVCVLADVLIVEKRKLVSIRASHWSPYFHRSLSFIITFSLRCFTGRCFHWSFLTRSLSHTLSIQKFSFFACSVRYAIRYAIRITSNNLANHSSVSEIRMELFCLSVHRIQCSFLVCRLYSNSSTRVLVVPGGEKRLRLTPVNSPGTLAKPTELASYH